MSEERERKRKKRKKRRKRDKRAADPALVLAEHTQRNAVEVLQHQRALGLGGTVAIVGLALVGTGDSQAGAVVVVIGMLILMWAVHRFGRLGTERVTKPARVKTAR